MTRTTTAPARNPEDNALIRYIPATDLNGHPLRGWCHEYEIWTQDRTRLPWVMRGWVTGPDSWTALPVNPDADRDRWTEPLPERDAAARTMLAAHPDNAGRQRPDDPDAAAHTAAEPHAPSLEDVAAILHELSRAGGPVPGGFTWRRSGPRRGRLTHTRLTDSRQADQARDALAERGLTAYTLAKLRGRPAVMVVVAPPVHFRAR